jgi:hypothetical protein
VKPSDPSPAQPSIFLSEASHSRAKTSVLRAKVRASLVRALACGASTQGSFASYSPGTSSWKTSQLSLVENLERYSETWPRAGTIAGGTAFLLPPSEPLTAEIGSTWSRGEYPTPSATDYGTSQNEGQVPHGMPSTETAQTRMDDGRRNLDDAVALWPPPICRDARGPQGGQQRQGSATLSETTRMWPTATAGDAASSGSRASRGMEGNQANEGTSLTDATCRSGRPLLTTCTHGGPCQPVLSPVFVEWLMGFPWGWTRLSAQGLATLASELSATRSSRKSQKSAATSSPSSKKRSRRRKHEQP